MIEYTLKLNSTQAAYVLKAVDLLMRLKINQPEEISRDVLDGMYERLGSNEYCNRRDKANSYLRLAFLEIFPTWDEVKKDDEWHSLYNIYQALRYQRHLAEYPNSKGVDSYPPMHFGGEEIPECTWEKIDDR